MSGLRDLEGLLNGFTKLFLAIFVLSAPAVAHAHNAASPHAHDDDPDILKFTNKLRQGRPLSPLEQSLEEVIRAAHQGEDGGFEVEEEIKGPGAPSAEKARFEALQDYVAKASPLEATRACVWFLASNPDNPHNPDVQTMLKDKASSMTSAQQGELRAYLDVRKGLSGSNKSRAKGLEKWSKRNDGNAFSDTAKREANYLREVASNQAAEKGSKRSRIIVRVGVVALVVLLVGVVLLGAA